MKYIKLTTLQKWISFVLKETEAYGWVLAILIISVFIFNRTKIQHKKVKANVKFLPNNYSRIKLYSNNNSQEWLGPDIMTKVIFVCYITT